MNTRGIGTLCICALMGVLLSACSMVESPSELIETPQIQDTKKMELKKKINQLLPASTEFLTPDHGTVKQSIYLEDVDGDKNQEAFILYKGVKETPTVQVLVLKEEDGDWAEISNINTDYQSLHYFGIHDLEGDKVPEVVIGLGPADFETKKQLHMYQWDAVTGLMKGFERSYELIDVANYDEDEKLELLLVHGNRRENFTAELFRYRNKKLESLSAVSLNAYAFHENTVSGKLNDGTRAFFIDSGVGAHSMITEMVAYTDGELMKIEEKAIKSYPLYSKDINGDGVIEVGGMYIPNGWENEVFSDIPFIETYSSYSIDGETTKIEERVKNQEHRFIIEIPSKWHGKVTVKKLQKGIQLLSVSKQEFLFEVKWSEKKTFESSSKTVLEGTKDTVFYTEIKEHSTFPFKQFRLLEDEF